jgi:cytochrome P450
MGDPFVPPHDATSLRTERAIVFASYRSVRASLTSKHLVAEEYPAASLHGGSGGYRSTAAYTQLKRRLNDADDLATWRDPVRDICQSWIARAAAKRVFCVVRDYAQPVMLEVTARLLSATVHGVERWGSRLAALADAGQDHLSAARAAANELQGHVGRQLTTPSLDPCGLLGDRALRSMPADSVLNAVTVMLAAGHGTTADMIGNAVVALLQSGCPLSSVRDDPRLTGRLVEEALRFDPSVAIVERVVVAPGEIDGVALRPGARVEISLAAANRDPATFPDGARFVPDAQPTRHLAFGLGASYCIGSSLARLCLREAVFALAAGVADCTLVPGSVVWKPPGALRGPSTALLEVRS